jgi:hypothetical protein
MSVPLKPLLDAVNRDSKAVFCRYGTIYSLGKNDEYECLPRHSLPTAIISHLFMTGKGPCGHLYTIEQVDHRVPDYNRTYGYPSKCCG